MRYSSKRTKNCENCFFDLTICINEFIRNSKFPDSLKLSDITPLYKNVDPSDKASYRPVNFLPLLSKVFEKIIYDQLYEYLEYLVILRFSKSTFQATCSLQADSETA